MIGQIVEVESTSEGIVFPRVNSTADVTAPVEGTVVYQTAATKGLYQYDGTSWSIIGGSSATDTEHFLMVGWVSGALSERWTFLNSGFGNSNASSQHMMPFNGTLTNLNIKPIVAVPAGANALFTVQKNGSDTSLQLSFNSGDVTTLKEDTDEVAVVKGDLITLRMQETNNAAISNYFAVSLELK